MAKITRGQFLGFGAALAGAGALAHKRPRAAVRPRRTALAAAWRRRGRRSRSDRHQRAIYTVDPARPRAEAFAVKNGRFIAVGSTADVRNLATSRTQVLDAQQA